jgi:hypothetical protein
VETVLRDPRREDSRRCLERVRTASPASARPATPRVRPAAPTELPAIDAWSPSSSATPPATSATSPRPSTPSRCSSPSWNRLGLDGTVVAVDGDQVVGVLAAEWDDDPPRVWWHGPVVAPARTGRRSPTRSTTPAVGSSPPACTEEEHAPDARHEELAAFAARHGAVAGEGSVVLGRQLDGTSDDAPRATLEGIVLRPFEERTGPRSRPCTTRCSPTPTPAGTGSTRAPTAWCGSRCVTVRSSATSRPSVRRTARATSTTSAWPRPWGGTGSARAPSSRDGVRLSYAARGCPSVHLTVRASNVAARRVYARCGFAEERELVPWRRGFTVA